MERYLSCPCCRQLLYGEFQLEGEVETPRPEDAYVCRGCGWEGLFSELSAEPIITPPPELDYQI